jgi:hypothetical protein
MDSISEQIEQIGGGKKNIQMTVMVTYILENQTWAQK